MEKTTIIGPIYNAKELGAPKTFVLGIQHMFAMFGSTVLVPQLTGLSVSSTLLFAGVGTLLFHFVSKRKVPAFLGSSFAFLAGYFTIAPNGEKDLLPYACLAVACSAILYFVLASFIKIFGVKKVMKFFPPVVTGPIIISIGLTLSQSAVNSCSINWIISLVAILVVLILNIWGRGMLKILPILIASITSYAVASIMGKVDWTPVANASWIGFPVKSEDTIFVIFKNPNTSLIITSIITIMPLAIATMMEHIGDIAAISSTVNRNFFDNPGLHRTLLGDGLATLIASIFGAPANTTYGENTGVLTLSKVYDPFVIRLAAVFAILFSFSPKFAALISCMPAATVGGISIVLYGMISAVGVRNIVESKVDFKESRNVIIAALILVLSIGIKFSSVGAINIHFGSINVGLSGLAVASIVGIVLNAILPSRSELGETSIKKDIE